MAAHSGSKKVIYTALVGNPQTTGTWRTRQQQIVSPAPQSQALVACAAIGAGLVLLRWMPGKRPARRGR